jgi:hypothetical protein
MWIEMLFLRTTSSSHVQTYQVESLCEPSVPWPLLKAHGDVAHASRVQTNPYTPYGIVRRPFVVAEEQKPREPAV